MIVIEIWKPIEGYENYYMVSNLGNVKSISRSSSRRERLLIPHLKNGYFAVNLYDDVGKCKHHYVHRLVAQTFLVGRIGHDVVNHKDCNKLNNKLSNLEWCTQKENIQHSIEHGLQRLRYKTIVDGIVYSSMKEASSKAFDKTYNVVNLLHQKFGSEFIYKGKFVKVVINK